MTDQLEIIVCGAQTEAERSVGESRIRDLKPSLGNVSADEWNALLKEMKAEFLAISEKPRPVGNQELEENADKLASDPATVGLLLFPRTAANSTNAWQTYPARLAALCENPAERVSAVVFRVSALQELGFEAVSEPLWDLVIRASAKPRGFQAVELANDASQTGTPPEPVLPELSPGHPGSDRRWLKAHLDAFTLEGLGETVASPADAVALQSGLLQIHDYLDASHELSQSVQGKGRNRAGDYWHAIMHRREPDYSNSKYWYRNVGSHPIFGPLANALDLLLSETKNPAAESARQKLGGNWDPFAFVDFCQECERTRDPDLTKIAEEIQWREMQLLLEQTWRDATA